MIRAGWRDTERSGGEIQSDESWAEDYSMDKSRAGTALHMLEDRVQYLGCGCRRRWGCRRRGYITQELGSSLAITLWCAFLRCIVLHITLCTVHCAPCTVHYALFTVHRALCTMRCSLCTVHCLVYTAHCSLCTAYYALSTVHCTLYTVHCSLCTVHCSQCALGWTEGCLDCPLAGEGWAETRE